MSKTIRIISSQSNSAMSITSNASTWGELKSELSSRIDNINDMKAIIKENRTTLEHSLGELPTTNFTLILSMKKIESGSDIRYSDTQLKELRTKLLNLFNDILNDNFDLNEPTNQLTEEEIEELDSLRDEGLIK
jgi:hypothetical protein